jgi:hypothetical protein
MKGEERLTTLSSSVLKKRLADEWTNNLGACISILGIMAVACPDNDFTEYFSSINSGGRSAKLNKWLLDCLEGRHPYTFALTVKGLAAINKTSSLETLFGRRNKVFNINYCIRLLRRSRERAMTLRSKELLDEMITFMEEFGRLRRQPDMATS